MEVNYPLLGDGYCHDEINTEECQFDGGDCCGSSGISEGEGPCKSDEECFGHLLCGRDNCPNPFSMTSNCCYDPTPSKHLLT